ncbi:MAG TPA: response regulator, partial [Acidobacteriaceae bacterium]|nr:response regulator [Acidobacteriaceae bacterium]
MPHVLLIDDDKDCLTALANRLRFAFRGQNVEVDVADSAITGLMLCHASSYDVLIVDVLMPGTTGLKFVEQLRRTKPDVPLIMISGGDVARCEEQAGVLGVVAVLPKPLDFATLLRTIHEVLESDKSSTSDRRPRR